MLELTSRVPSLPLCPVGQLSSAPSEVAVPSVPAPEDDDIMAGTGLSAEDQQNAQASPADPSAPSPTTTAAPPPQEDRSVAALTHVACNSCQAD